MVVSGCTSAGSESSCARKDLTGYWVSIVTEDWRYRMVTPAKRRRLRQRADQRGRA